MFLNPTDVLPLLIWELGSAQGFCLMSCFFLIPFHNQVSSDDCYDIMKYKLRWIELNYFDFTRISCLKLFGQLLFLISPCEQWCSFHLFILFVVVAVVISVHSRTSHKNGRHEVQNMLKQVKKSVAFHNKKSLVCERAMTATLFMNEIMPCARVLLNQSSRGQALWSEWASAQLLTHLDSNTLCAQFRRSLPVSDC